MVKCGFEKAAQSGREAALGQGAWRVTLGTDRGHGRRES
jgi:hypothetical protein